MDNQLPLEMLGEFSKYLDWNTYSNLSRTQRGAPHALRAQEREFLEKPRQVILLMSGVSDGIVRDIHFQNLAQFFSYINSKYPKFNEMISKGIGTHSMLPDRIDQYNFGKYYENLIILSSWLSEKYLMRDYEIETGSNYAWNAFIIEGKYFGLPKSYGYFKDGQIIVHSEAVPVRD